MSIEYDEYLAEHRENVVKAMNWMFENIPEVLADYGVKREDVDWLIAFGHDFSKGSFEEYHAYDHWFYGNNRSYAAKQSFDKAWLHHIHNNPHHWQHWVLMNDDPEEGTICLPMPSKYVIEMICDWWSFSWKTGNLLDIIDWWVDHSDRIQLNAGTQLMVMQILAAIQNKLEEK